MSDFRTPKNGEPTCHRCAGSGKSAGHVCIICHGYGYMRQCSCRANGCNEFHLKCFCGCLFGHPKDHPLAGAKARLIGLPDPYACVFEVKR